MDTKKMQKVIKYLRYKPYKFIENYKTKLYWYQILYIYISGIKDRIVRKLK